MRHAWYGILVALVFHSGTLVAQTNPPPGRGAPIRGGLNTGGGRTTVSTPPKIRLDRDRRRDQVRGQSEGSEVEGRDPHRIAWNNSGPAAGRPYFLYLAPRTERHPEDEFHQLFESVTASTHLVRVSQQLICERVALEQLPFVAPIEGREAMFRCWKTMAMRNTTAPRLLFLDDAGHLLLSVDKIEDLRKLGPAGLIQKMKAATEETNKRRKKMAEESAP